MSLLGRVPEICFKCHILLSHLMWTMQFDLEIGKVCMWFVKFVLNCRGTF